MKKHWIWLLIFVLSLAGCGTEETGWQGFSGTMEGYEYRWPETQQRERAWEEDILYLAQICLDNHPYVSGEMAWVYTYREPFGGKTSGFSEEIHREDTRTTFIELVNEVIDRIPECTDVQMVYEAARIVASLGDIHSGVVVTMEAEAVFPIRYDYFIEDGTMAVYAVETAGEYADIYLGRLSAINGVPVEDVVNRLIPYISAENAYYPPCAVVKGRLFAQNALHVAGIMGLEDESAVFTFETEGGTVDRTIMSVSREEYRELSLVSHPMTADSAIMNRRDGNYWYELLEENVLYMRLSSMSEEEDYSFLRYLMEAAGMVQTAQQPLRLVMDFRSNQGGPEHLSQWKTFVESIRDCPMDGVYILINEECVSSGVAAPYQLARSIENAKLVGSPTAQFPNSPAAQTAYALPNRGTAFYISSDFFRFAPEETDSALRPDIEVRQSWEDYLSETDTVLEYILTFP